MGFILKKFVFGVGVGIPPLYYFWARGPPAPTGFFMVTWTFRISTFINYSALKNSHNRVGYNKFVF
jgi:hypothetical protein